jgi:hypothetical protein
MPESLKAVAKTLAEIKEIAYLPYGKFVKLYVSPEGQVAINKWQEIRSRCSAAREKAEKKIVRPRMTVEDGLPADFVALDNLQDEAKEAYTEWDEATRSLRTIWSEPDNYKLPFGTSTVRRLGEMAWKRVSDDRNAVGKIRFDIEKLLEPKTREGTIVRRVRQEFCGEWRKRQEAAGKVAYDRAMKRLGGDEAESQAKVAERKGEAAREADLRVLCQRLEVELAAYLLDIGESDVAERHYGK